MPLNMKSIEKLLQQALTDLLFRGGPDSFVLIEALPSGKFVQFGRGPVLILDLPLAALEDEEAQRAAAFFADLGEEFPREYEAPHPETGKMQFGATYDHDFQGDVLAATRAALEVFRKVYRLPRDVELLIQRNGY